MWLLKNARGGVEWKFCSRHPCLFFNVSALEINRQPKENEMGVPKIQVSWNLNSCISLRGLSTHKFARSWSPSLNIWDASMEISVNVGENKMSLILRGKRIQWNRISPLRQVLVDGTGIWSLMQVSSASGRLTALPTQVLAQPGPPAHSLIISQGRIVKQARKERNLSSWVSIIEWIIATIIETYYGYILFLILTNLWMLKDIFDNVTSLLETLQGLPVSFRGKAKVLTRPYRNRIPVWSHLLPPTHCSLHSRNFGTLTIILSNAFPDNSIRNDTPTPAPQHPLSPSLLFLLHLPPSNLYNLVFSNPSPPPIRDQWEQEFALHYRIPMPRTLSLEYSRSLINICQVTDLTNAWTMNNPVK